jgi:hypothetical protein
MSFDDPQSSQTVSNDPSPDVNPPAPSSPSTPPTQPQPSQPSQADSKQTLSNAGPIAQRGVQDPQMTKAVDVTQHPLVQKASLMHSVAQALAGNPKRVWISDDGVRHEEPLPASGKSLMAAIALEALQGSLAGLAYGRGKGPGAAGLGAMQQAQQRRQQEQQRQDELAEKQHSDRATALAQQASSYQANLRTRALAQEVGERDEKSHQDWIAAHASTVQYLRDMAPGAIIKDNAPESEITDPAFTSKALQNGWVAIPIGYVPRYDAQGNHFSQDGVPLHDNLFMIADGRKLTVPPDIIQKAQSWNIAGFVGWKDKPVNLANFELRLGTILDTSNKVSSLELEQKDLIDYYAYLNSKGLKGADGQPLVAPDLKQLVQKNPALINYIVGPWANHFGSTPGAALKVMKDGSPKGSIAALYGGQQLLDKYDLLKDLDKKGSEKQLDANIDIAKERALVPIHAANAKAEAQAKADVASASSHNEDGSWNPASLPVGLVEGTVDPSQLSKRGSTYNAQLEDANRYSLSKYGKPFDIAKAQQDYTYAKNTQTQNTLRMINGMTEPGGAIQIAADAAKNLPQFNSATLNKVFNAAATEFGNAQASNFHTAMLGLADEYSKVMGGGISSDTGRQQSLDLLRAAYSKGQLAGAISIMQRDLAARKSAIVGDNRYLQRQFGGSPARTSGGQAGPPAGATMKVPGSDGKLHWSDGKSDLGVVQ